MSDPYEGVDLEHLAACVDPHCCYCNTEEPIAKMDGNISHFLTIMQACRFDLAQPEDLAA